MEIALQQVTVTYKQKKETNIALKDINLILPDESFVVLYGPSGCGKTTLLKTLIGLIDYEGSITFNHQKDVVMSTQDRKISYISQKNVLYPNLTIYDNLAFPLKMEHVGFEEIKKRIFEVTERLGITGLLTRKPKQISLGQQQQVSLAKGIIKQSLVFLFDEPFANIDPVKRTSLRHQLKKLHTELKQNFIFVTHDLQEAIVLGTHIVFMDAGKVIAFKTVESVIEDIKKEGSDEKYL